MAVVRSHGTPPAELLAAFSAKTVGAHRSDSPLRRRRSLKNPSKHMLATSDKKSRAGSLQAGGTTSAKPKVCSLRRTPRPVRMARTGRRARRKSRRLEVPTRTVHGEIRHSSRVRRTSRKARRKSRRLEEQSRAAVMRSPGKLLAELLAACSVRTVGAHSPDSPLQTRPPKDTVGGPLLHLRKTARSLILIERSIFFPRQDNQVGLSPLWIRCGVRSPLALGTS